mmetsp:Transcript_69309/g.122698  ORF Transcript_69309/g.122698 Transcript_69309/m.122698 type:complete len:723 (+) Transcript_69309:53-2221(+)|eukprot:CAMPEP_0197654872 /NCGR_PEP_ID=MMETSP1338-20131121/39109_1 /TAXON_ID=43686 ORGANISM="Pelagodinium beii, Strain RCC1491" /NCGR_SAMPLE_ID=MMETSP1338 /ASSEMBLY_ACC=CAM_ASM_000754 /LENGTH=722 /DNA_ID=CAMNT_0043230401 /DNA_START=53 /DNA_END=2221 /DNA_ORIENTATION=-
MSAKKKDKGGGYLAKEADDTKFQELEERLSKKISGLETTLGASLSDEVSKIKEHIDGANQRSDEGFTKVGKETGDKLTALRKELMPKIEEAFTKLAGFDEFKQVIVQKVEADIGMGIETERAQREEMRDLLKTAIVEAAKEVREIAHHQASEYSAQCLNELEKQVLTLRQEIASVSPPLHARCETLQGGLNTMSAELSKSTSYVDRSVTELGQLVKQTKESLEESVADCLQKSVEAAAASAGKVKVLAQQVEDNEKSLRLSSLLSENVNCRTLSWRCASFRKRLLKVVQAEASTLSPGIRSPDFSLCALPDMQLELGLTARGVAGESDGPKPPLPGATGPIAPPLPVPSSCTLRLWAPPGLQIIFRVTLGEGPSSTTKRFEHTFGEKPDLPELPEKEWRSFFQVHNFCQLDQAWVRDDDSVQVHFEVLEFKLLPEGSKWRSTALKQGPDEAEEKEDAAEADATAAPDVLARPEEGDPDHIDFIRSQTSEALMHERLQRDIMVIKNKMVRRVEWKVEGCSRLLEHCEVGKGFDSPIFTAAGIERLQFHFYPRGHEMSGSGGTQPCGVFISGPGRGVTLRGMMWVGVNNRSVEHRFQRKGDLGGRPRFCPLESQLDCDDTVVIALDISEVEHELPDHGQALMLREARSTGGSESTSGANLSKMSTTSSIASPAHTGAKGIMRMKREDPTKTEELVKSITLPTLNARTMSQMSLAMNKSRRSVDF